MMTGLELNPQIKLSNVKETFSKSFPYLKLEFFKNSHDGNEPSSVKELIKKDLLLSDLNADVPEGILVINPETKVNELESGFRERFGLNVQVFRKSGGNTWLETCGTDELSLNEQNNLGKEKSFPPEQPDLNDIDYD